MEGHHAEFRDDPTRHSLTNLIPYATEERLGLSLAPIEGSRIVERPAERRSGAREVGTIATRLGTNCDDEVGRVHLEKFVHRRRTAVRDVDPDLTHDGDSARVETFGIRSRRESLQVLASKAAGPPGSYLAAARGSGAYKQNAFLPSHE